jgi:hypothetical protein
MGRWGEREMGERVKGRMGDRESGRKGEWENGRMGELTPCNSVIICETPWLKSF